MRKENKGDVGGEQVDQKVLWNMVLKHGAGSLVLSGQTSDHFDLPDTEDPWCRLCWEFLSYMQEICPAQESSFAASQLWDGPVISLSEPQFPKLYTMRKVQNSTSGVIEGIRLAVMA